MQFGQLRQRQRLKDAKRIVRVLENYTLRIFSYVLLLIIVYTRKESTRDLIGIKEGIKGEISKMNSHHYARTFNQDSGSKAASSSPLSTPATLVTSTPSS